MSLRAEVADADEMFSSPIISPLYTNTIVETNNENNNDNDNDIDNENNNNKSEDPNAENQNNKLRPRYNISPTLGNRIEQVSSQTEKSLPAPSQIKQAEFNRSKNKTPSQNTTAAHYHHTPSTSDPFGNITQPNIIGNLNGMISPLDLPAGLSVAQNNGVQNNVAQNAVIPNNQPDEIMPLDIPDSPDCNNDSYNKFVGGYGGYFFGDQKNNHRQYNNNGFFCGGWVEGGIFFSTNSNDSQTPIIKYNDRNSEFTMNQLYLTLGRKLNRRHNWFEIGGQIDLLFGTDYLYTSSVGLETRRTNKYVGGNTIYPDEAAAHWNGAHGKRLGNTAALYGLSLPQAYGEIRLPVNENTTVKVGHFYANNGIESAAAVQNFFYSHSYGYMFGQPVTLTGAIINSELPSYRRSRIRQIFIAGITQGWDMFDRQGDINFVAGLKYVSKKNERNYVSFITQIGKQSDANSHSRINYTLAINRQLTERLSDSWEHNFGYEKNGVILKNDDACWISVAKYFKYDISSKLSVGLRAEWFMDDGLSRVIKVYDSWISYYTGKNYFEVTLGANWRPAQNIIIRPELRFDWSDFKQHSLVLPAAGAYNGHKNMTSFAVDAIIRF
ncbi:MAG: porin [Planctomycetaceae bacterium]|nr:porin [Planctomycetaceae bacterium]